MSRKEREEHFFPISSFIMHDVWKVLLGGLVLKPLEFEASMDSKCSCFDPAILL